ncbi:hypothetical protein Tco_0217758 [Tanacetum coccineum]
MMDDWSEQEDWSMEFDARNWHFGQVDLVILMEQQSVDAPVSLALWLQTQLDSELSLVHSMERNFIGDETVDDCIHRKTSKEEKAYKAVTSTTSTIIPPRAKCHPNCQNSVVKNLGQRILGKQRAVKLCFVCYSPNHLIKVLRVSVPQAAIQRGSQGYAIIGQWMALEVEGSQEKEPITMFFLKYKNVILSSTIQVVDEDLATEDESCPMAQTTGGMVNFKNIYTSWLKAIWLGVLPSKNSACVTLVWHVRKGQKEKDICWDTLLTAKGLESINGINKKGTENYADSKEQGISCDDVEDMDDQQFIVHTAQPMPPEERTAAKEVKPASTPIEAHKSLGKDEEGEDVDVHLYRFQVTPKVSLILQLSKGIFRAHVEVLGPWYTSLGLSPKSTSWEQFGANIALSCSYAEDIVTKSLWDYTLDIHLFLQGLLKLPIQRAAHSQRTAAVQGTASFSRYCYSQGMLAIHRPADFQGTAEPHDAASIPKSPNDYTPTDASQTSGGDEGTFRYI